MIDDEEPARYGDNGERRTVATIYAAGVRLHTLLEGKFGKNIIGMGLLSGGTRGAIGRWNL